MKDEVKAARGAPFCPEADTLCPQEVHRLLDIFAAAGVGAYPVGGCVRDALMGRVPHDWDVTVTCPPEQTVALCEAAGLQTIPTGIAHGTVTVLVPGEAGRMPLECTTCRTEEGYSDGRHPDRVTFSDRLEDDLSRRDFTINAMAVERDEAHRFHLIDCFGGLADLRAGVIRCVGEPERRLREDALRVLRGVRFAVRLGFEPEPDTAAALCRCAEGLTRISGERVREELRGILCSPDPDRGVRMLFSLGMWPHILPHPPTAGLRLAERGGFAAPCGGSGDRSGDPFPTRLAALLFDMEEPALTADLARLKLSREEETRTRARLSLRDYVPTAQIPLPEAARRLRAECGREAIPALEVARGYAAMQEAGTSTFPQDAMQKYPQHDPWDDLIRQVALSEEDREPVTVTELALDGRALISLGVPPGREVGRVLSCLLEAVLCDPARNTPSALTAFLREHTEYVELP